MMLNYSNLANYYRSRYLMKKHFNYSYLEIDGLLSQIRSGTMTEKVRSETEGLVPRPNKTQKPKARNPLAGLVDYSAAMRKDAEEFQIRDASPEVPAESFEVPEGIVVAPQGKELKGTAIKSGDPLESVNEDLVRVMKRAAEISKQPFKVIEGVRGKERQAELVKKGASKTMNSRHLVGNAIDIAPVVDGKVSWDWQYYDEVARAMKEAAKELNVNVEWGGDWKSFKDGPHWQIAQKSDKG